MQIQPQDYPVVMLSYDEPNCEDNWQHLVKHRPDAHRVHGIKGSDRAHKQCAEVAQEQRFFTVDGDCRVDPVFWRSQHSAAPLELDQHSVLSFSSRNVINGLCYGNGGIKLWDRDTVMNMQTHEASLSADSTTDFCWALDYVLMPGVWSQTVINCTEYQAWRAGFREGVKFTQIQGRECKDANVWQNSVAEVNQQRLCIWQQLGMDARFGAWSILGARQGFYHALLGTWATDQLQDFDMLAVTFEQLCSGLTAQNLRTEIVRLGREILDNIYLDITAEPPTADVSRWCKRMWPAEPRTQAKRLR